MPPPPRWLLLNILKMVQPIFTKLCDFYPSEGQTGGGGGMDATNYKFSNFSQKWEEPFLKTKFLPVGSSLGHLPMKKIFKSDLPSGL